MEIAETFDFLLGGWSLQRTIIDHRTDQRGTFLGTAELRRSGSPTQLGRPARYEEVGRLRHGSYDGQARRALSFVPLDTGAARVNFSNGQHFFDLDLRTGACRAEHPCGEDRYELEVICRTEALIEEYWRVRGPLKDYEAATTWRRDARRDALTPAGAASRRRPR